MPAHEMPGCNRKTSNHHDDEHEEINDGGVGFFGRRQLVGAGDPRLDGADGFAAGMHVAERLGLVHRGDVEIGKALADGKKG